MSQPVKPCTATASMCKCIILNADHITEVPHECSCGGKWKGEIDTDSFEVIAYPIPVTELANLFGDVFDLIDEAVNKLSDAEIEQRLQPLPSFNETIHIEESK